VLLAVRLMRAARDEAGGRPHTLRLVCGLGRGASGYGRARLRRARRCDAGCKWFEYD